MVAALLLDLQLGKNLVSECEKEVKRGTQQHTHVYVPLPPGMDIGECFFVWLSKCFLSNNCPIDCRSFGSVLESHDEWMGNSSFPNKKCQSLANISAELHWGCKTQWVEIVVPKPSGLHLLSLQRNIRPTFGSRSVALSNFVANVIQYRAMKHYTNQ